MPGQVTLKKLYISSSVGDLNKKAEVPSSKLSSSRVYAKSADKVLSEAKLAESLGDEERAYVLYMKYFNLVTIIKKCPDYKKQKEYIDSFMGTKNVMSAIEKAERLSKSLTYRYDFHEAEMVSEKLAALDRKSQELDKSSPEDEGKTIKEEENKDKKNAAEIKKNTKSTPPPQQTSISSTNLFKLMQDTDEAMIIMDVRPIDQYQESRIQHRSCINVPADIIPAGTTEPYIRKSLPEESRSLWQQRGQVEHNILLDWNSSIGKVKVGTTLNNLRDALYKYDSTVSLKSLPLILEGGYEQWLLYYPTWTTNSKVTKPSFSEIMSPIVSLDFDYPDFDEAFSMTPPAKPVRENKTEEPINKQVNLNNQIEMVSVKKEGYAMPQVDRTTKPKHRTLPSPDSQKHRTLPSPDSQTNGMMPDMTKPKSTNERSAETNSQSELSTRRSHDKEMNDFHLERERMLDEQKAQTAQLKLEQEKIELLEKMRREEEKNVAELMRKKRNIEESMKMDSKQIEEHKQREEVERLRNEEFEKVKRQEEEKVALQKRVDQMRLERKKKEESDRELDRIKVKMEEDKAIALLEEQKKLEEENKRVIEDSQRKEAEDRLQTIERQRKIEQESKEAEAKAKMEINQKLELERDELEKRTIEEQKRQELERIEAEVKRKAEIEKQQLEEKRIQEEIERQTKEKVLKEERAREQQREKEQMEKELAERVKKAEEEKQIRLNEERKKKLTVPSPNLPVGWEKRQDRSTGRYFYVDHHNNKTQWEPPPLEAKASNSYTTQLKDEPETPTRGLSRSHSSPNIAKMMEDEDATPAVKPLPRFDRSAKPAERKPEIMKIQPARIRNRDLNPVYGNMGRALSGLKNLGNTCYMNSIVQCLNNTSPFVSYFISDIYLQDANRESESGNYGEVADEFAIIMKALWQGQYRCITPRDFKNTVSRYSPMFAGYQQQDSQEFLMFLLDGLHVGLNKVKTRPNLAELNTDNVPDHIAAEKSWNHHKQLHESIIVELFQGQLKSTLTCLTCGKKSVTFEAFMFLSLPIPSPNRCSLNDCLAGFLNEEKMSGSSQWRCSQCKVDRDAIKKIDIWKLPRILMIALNRFSYEGMWRQKLNTNINFPVVDVDFNNCITGPRQRAIYNLYAVSNHYGTMEGGHYTAFCRNPCTEKWYKFDDHEVYEMSKSDVRTSAGYILFYTSIALKPPEFRGQFM